MAPIINSISPNQGPAAGGTAVTLTGSGFTGASSVTFGTNPAQFAALSDTKISCTAPAGSGSSAVTVTSSGGTSNSSTFTYLPSPVVSSIAPNQGPTAGGNTVTVTGTNLSGTTAVVFGSHSATITGNTSTQITVQPPAGAAAPVNLTVTTAGGTSTPLPYFYIPLPTVDDISPALGPPLGGNAVTVTGSNLSLISTVRFGSRTSASISVVSDGEITALVPLGSGTVSVTATTPGGTSLPGVGNPYYTYVGQPVITSLSPNQGPAAGGNSVTITGSNLTYTDSVRVGGILTSFVTVSDTEVVAVAPGGTSGTVAVLVHSPGGTSSASYQYTP
ncbi:MULTISPECIES: IPT/TIG domain-containing protein [Streptomyces]|uniref:IPT/TIG domain-containing protein n=1 Tax=Streptomyces TaxID=1883 RepID=UPI0013691288|nr:IPT/TIG domain-containing protein [Streptomyces sp. SID2888]MYV44222.1 cell shape-determining protein [Streptomyces sp. SID2888]